MSDFIENDSEVSSSEVSEYFNKSDYKEDGFRITDEMKSEIYLSLDYEIVKKPFVIVCFNVTLDNCSYYPSEMAMIKFNIKDGILSRFHRFLDSGTFDNRYNINSTVEVLGNIRDSITNRYLMDTRRLSYMSFLAEIDNFFQDYPGQFPDEVRPPLKTFYTNDSQVQQCAYSFYYISKQAQLSTFYSKLKLCRISELVYNLCLKKKVTFTEIDCKRSLYNFQYQSYNDCTQHLYSSYFSSCAFRTAVQLAYNCCSLLCPLFDVLETPNRYSSDHLFVNTI